MMYYRRGLLAKKAFITLSASGRICHYLNQSMISDYRPALYWDSAFAIALALIENHPKVDPEKIGLEELASLVERLPGFVDDPDFVTDRILLDIIVAWYEELHSL